MRSVANECKIALGSLYNYFSSKDELIMETIQSVWQDIFHMDEFCLVVKPFAEYVDQIYRNIQEGTKEYPNFFTTHSLSFASEEKSTARETMENYFRHMKKGMLSILAQDPKVKKDVFNSHFTQTDFIDFVLNNILILLIQDEKDDRVLIEVIRHTIY